MSTKYRLIPQFFGLAILLLSWVPCRAQFSSNVQGTVTDSSGAVVSAASIGLHNVETGVDLEEKTNGSGFYRFSAVAPGNYTVNAKLQGFKPTSISVSLSTGETHGVDITLALAAAGTTNVTVTEAAPALNMDENRLQTTLSSEEIKELPLPNRDVQLLLALTPGVVGFQNESPSNGYGSSVFAGNFQPPYTANGEGVQGNLFLIDDLPVSDDITQGAALILPNADMINQVALQSQTYSVENGTAASVETAFDTKSGGNSFHGSIDYTYAGKNFGAANAPIRSPTFIGDPTVIDVDPEFHQNFLLGSFGGPIIKDHTFFFGSIEKQNAGIGTAGGTNPYFTPAFAAWALTAFPNSGAAKGLNFAPPTRDSGGTPKYAADYGIACGSSQTVSASAGLTYNLPCDIPIYQVGATFDQAQPFDGLQWNVRLDESLREGKDRIYVMYERIDQNLGDLAERPKLDAISPSQNKYFSANYIHLFTPRLLNELHAGNLRAIQNNALSDVRSNSIPYLPILLDTAAGFQFTFPFGLTPFGSRISKEHTYAVRDTVSYSIGNHTIRGGYQFYRGDAFQDNSGVYSRPFVPFYFTDTFSWVSNTAQTGYSLYTIGGNGQYTPQYYGATSIYNGVFVEDSWKLRPNLTITAGIRYDDFGNPTKYGSTAQPFVPMFPGAGATFQQQAWATTTKVASTAFTEAQNLNFLPRFGFAYSRPTSEHPMLVRGGVGLYENAMTSFQIAQNLPTQPPNRISLYDTSVVPYGDFSSQSAPYGYTYPATPVFGTDPSGNIYSNAAHTAVYSANLNGLIPTLKPEKFLNYSLGVEQQLPANVVLGITYAGSHGYDLVYGSVASGGGGNDDYNLLPNSPKARPTSEWGTLNYGRNGLSSSYNALIVTLKQNYKQLTYQANYNFSRALQYAPTFSDNNTGDFYSIWKGIYDPKSYYGPTAFDRTNTFSLGGTYEVPTFASGRLLNEAASHWRIGTIIIAQSGTPFTVDNTGVDYQNDGGFAFDGVGGATPAFPTFTGSKRRGFTRREAITGAFTAAQFVNPSGTGNGPVTAQQGANTFRNLGYFNVDATVSKGFTVPLPKRPDGAKFYLRGEAVNLLNRTNWQSIVNGETSGAPPLSFGSVTAANQKRYLQLGGRFEF